MLHDTFYDMIHTFRTTTLDETLQSHLYIDRYTDPDVKNCIHTYKFAQDRAAEAYTRAKHTLVQKTIDLCIYMYTNKTSDIEKTCHIYTSPPSTMFERGEKDIDSMFELIYTAISKIKQYLYTSRTSYIHASHVYKVSSAYIKKHQAQHIGGNKKTRTYNLYHRYGVSLRHKLMFWYYIHIHNITRFSYIIIDDVSSTGGTLVACKHTLLTYLKHMQGIYPNITFDVEILSLTH